MSEQEEQRKVAVVIVAHHDDAEFGSAGTVARWVREGWQVHYVICADGSGGGPDEALDVGPEARRKLIATRKAEQRAAADILGVSEVVFLDYPDGMLTPSIELRRDLVRLLRRFRPTRVVCPSPERSWEPRLMIGRYHPDHLAVGEAALAAIYPACQNPWDFPELLEEGLRPHVVREVFIVGSPHNNHAENIAETIETKVAALRAHVSQVGTETAELEKRIYEWAIERGQAYGLQYAETYHFTEK